MSTKISPLSLQTYEKVEESVWRSVGLLCLVSLPIELSHFLHDFLLLIYREQIGNLQDIGGEVHGNIYCSFSSGFTRNKIQNIGSIFLQVDVASMQIKLTLKGK